MTSAMKLRNSMAEVVKREPRRLNAQTWWFILLSCGHSILTREKEQRTERRCPHCRKGSAPRG